MLTYNFEKIDIPLYQYIYKCLKKDITDGVLKSGEKLPSKRCFAKNNGISTITVQNAYDQLISEGYIYTIPKKGYYVSNISHITFSAKAPQLTLDIAPQKTDRSDALNLSNSSLNPDNFPFSVWAKTMRTVFAEMKDELMAPSPAGGVQMLKEAIAEHLFSFKGIVVDPMQIVVGAGTEYLYSLIIQLLGRDKIYCIENPGYMKLKQIYTLNNIEYRTADLDEYGMSASQLAETGADIAHISPAHHFPTGITMPAKRRYEMLAWANEKEGRFIIEDDYDSEFRTNGKPIPPIFGIDVSGKVIYMNTFSKSLSSTIRISYMVLPTPLTSLFYKKLSFYSCTVSTFEQYTLAEFIKKGFFEKHINRMRLYYSRKRKELLDIISKSPVSDKCHVIENSSGLHFLLKIDTTLEDDKFTDELNKNNIRIKALSQYYLDQSPKSLHMFIIEYSNLDIEKFKNAINILAFKFRHE